MAFSTVRGRGTLAVGAAGGLLAALPAVVGRTTSPPAGPWGDALGSALTPLVQIGTESATRVAWQILAAVSAGVLAAGLSGVATSFPRGRTVAWPATAVVAGLWLLCVAGVVSGVLRTRAVDLASLGEPWAALPRRAGEVGALVAVVASAVLGLALLRASFRSRSSAVALVLVPVVAVVLVLGCGVRAPELGVLAVSLAGLVVAARGARRRPVRRVDLAARLRGVTAQRASTRT